MTIEKIKPNTIQNLNMYLRNNNYINRFNYEKAYTLFKNLDTKLNNGYIKKPCDIKQHKLLKTFINNYNVLATSMIIGRANKNKREFSLNRINNIIKIFEQKKMFVHKKEKYLFICGHLRSDIKVNDFIHIKDNVCDTFHPVNLNGNLYISKHPYFEKVYFDYCPEEKNKIRGNIHKIKNNIIFDILYEYFKDGKLNYINVEHKTKNKDSINLWIPVMNKYLLKTHKINNIDKYYYNNNEFTKKYNDFKEVYE